METFKDIKGFKGFYQISNLGNVKSLKRSVRNGRCFRIVNEIMLRPETDKFGYKKVRLQKNRVSKKAFVHRLVAQAFIGNIPKEKQINHINRIKTDNVSSNLEIVTPRQNSHHIKRDRKLKTGVYFLKRTNNYQSTILVKGKKVCIGTFKIEQEANEAYDKFIIKNNIK